MLFASYSVMDLTTFQKIGFEEKEAKLYLSLLKRGSSSASQLSADTGIERTLCYSLLNKLIDKGYVSFIVVENVKKFQAVSPKKIFDELKEKEQGFKSVLPDLLALEKKHFEETSVEVFKGKAGIREVIFEDMLREGTDYYGFGEFLKFQKTFPIQLRQFLKRMERKNVTEHILFKEGQKVLVTRKHSRVRYIPQEMDFPSSIFMYGKTKVATVIWSDPPITILVKNKDVHDSYMSYFKLLWKMAKK